MGRRFAIALTSMCTSFGTKVKKLQMPTFLTRWRGEEVNEDDEERVPYAEYYSQCPDKVKNMDCAVCMGKIRHRPLIAKA